MFLRVLISAQHQVGYCDFRTNFFDFRSTNVSEYSCTVIFVCVDGYLKTTFTLQMLKMSGRETFMTHIYNVFAYSAYWRSAHEYIFLNQFHGGMCMYSTGKKTYLNRRGCDFNYVLQINTIDFSHGHIYYVIIISAKRNE